MYNTTYYIIVQLNQQSHCKHIQFPNNTNVLCVIWQKTIDLIVNKFIWFFNVYFNKFQQHREIKKCH